MLFLLDLPKGEEVTILAQKKKDGKLSEKGDVGSVVKGHIESVTRPSYPTSVSADRGVGRGRLLLHPDTL